ncbi:MAG: DUF1015 domain-containing protein [Gammaproteobacteria bacterium]|nr:DUF1015 domain-containing protein [Gammaproteobacteria bacterium]
MLNIKPITGYLAKQKYADTVVCPEYDNFTPVERRQFAEENPNNYINTIRYIDEFAPTESVSYKKVLKINRKKLQEILVRDFYEEIQDTLLIYQLETLDGHIQTGLMADVPFTDYENGAIRIHEYTRKDKEKGLSKYIKKVGAVSTPVCITYPRHSSIDDIISNVTTNNAPDVVLESDIIQRVWMVKDHSIYEELCYYFKQIDVTYLADGHHRIASGHRYAKRCKKKNPDHTGNEPYNYLLAVFFPDEEMLIHAYNRCVRDLNIAPKTLLRLLESDFTVEEHDDKYHAQPMHRHEFGMLLGEKWYKLIAKPENIPNDPVGVLAVSVLQNQILNPMLNISDPQKDCRLGYISGESDVEGMEKAIKDGFDVVFSAFPTSIQEMMDVADNDQIMPPKSTWFAPKLRSGLVVAFRKPK